MTRSPPLIAIVDDDESVRRAFSRLLISAGMQVESFARGAEFLASLARHEPDCVVLDLHMPGDSGFDVQTKLGQLGSHLPVVAITGHDTPDSRQRVMDAGGSAYLRKPVDEQVLLDAITAAVGSRRDGP